MHPPRRDVPAVQLESSNATSRLDVALLVVAHILLHDGDGIVFPNCDGSVWEGEERIDMIGTAGDGADELVVDPDR